MKKTNTITRFLTIILMGCAFSISAQPTSCNNLVNTGSNHTIVLANFVPTYNGNPLPNGSHIIVMYNDNGNLTCSGYAKWDGINTSFAAFGDDSNTPDKDGLGIGDLFIYRLELPNGSIVENDGITVEYAPVGAFFSNTDQFAVNGISGIVAFDAVDGGCPNIGATCNDGDTCTVNDIIDANCNCTGTYLDSDNDGTCDPIDLCLGNPEPGSPCNDMDGCTVNDTITFFCECIGTFQDSDGDGTCDSLDVCPGGPEPGSLCDDGNPNTDNDIIQPDCECKGTDNCTTVVSLNQIFPATCNGNDGRIAAVGLGGVAPLSFAWSNGFSGTLPQQQATQLNLPPGIYTITLTDGVGCTATASTEVGLDCPCPNVGNIGESCDDNDPTTINDVVQDDCTCKGEPLCDASVNLSIISPASCNNDDGRIDGVAISFPNGVAPITFNWSNGQSGDISGNAPIADLAAGIYTITVSDGTGCSATASAEIELDCDCPTIPGNFDEICDDNNPNTTNTTIQNDCTCGGGNTPVLNLTCPQNISVTVPSGQTNASVNYGQPVANSTCPNGNININLTAGLPSGSDFPLGNTLVSYSANDGCNNTENCSFNITVNAGPNTLDCDDVNISASNNNSIIIDGLIAPINEIQIFNDNWSSKIFSCIGDCDEPTQEINNILAGDYHVLIKFYDADYQSICKRFQDVSVGGNNNSSLQLNCPDNITVTAPMNQSSMVVNYNSPNVISTCTIGTPSIFFMSGLQSGSLFPMGTTLIKYEASDDCSNYDDCSFNVTVNSPQANPSCDDIQFSLIGDSIIINNLDAPITEVQLISGDWSNKIFRCIGDCDVPELTLPDLTPDIYHLIIKFYTADYQLICKRFQDVIIDDNFSDLIVFNLINTNLNNTTDVELGWVNNTQTKNDHFIIEKSTDGINFEEMEKIHEYNNLDKIELYNGLDKNPEEGINYYRIKLVYTDGSYSYSETKEIEFNPEADFTIFPNPATDKVNIYLKRYFDKEIDIVIYNTLGNAILKKHIDNLDDKILPINLNKNIFKEGIHIVSVIHKGRATSKKLVVARFD